MSWHCETDELWPIIHMIGLRVPSLGGPIKTIGAKFQYSDKDRTDGLKSQSSHSSLLERCPVRFQTCLFNTDNKQQCEIYALMFAL